MRAKLSLEDFVVKSFVTVMNNRSHLRGGIDPDFTNDCSDPTCETMVDCPGGSGKSSYPGGASACNTTP